MPSAVVFNRFPELAAEAAGKVAALVESTATEIENDIKGGGPHAAPIRTGNLRRSYHTDFAGTKAEIGNDTGIAPYAIFVEYGTYKMAARPHLRPAVEAVRAKFMAALAAILGGKGL